MSETAFVLHRFNGGLVLPSGKEVCTRLPIAPAPVPPQLVLPLKQTLGEAAEPVVRVGQTVAKGKAVAIERAARSAAVHASSSGKVIAIEERDVAHPSGLRAPCIVIETDGRDAWSEPRYAPERAALALPRQEMLRRIAAAGIAGLGGAVFPTSFKLNTCGESAIEWLVINGAECEPCISCDAMLMHERPAEVVEGTRILRHLLRAERCVIAMEDDIPHAFEAVSAAAAPHRHEGIDIVAVPTVYPTGGERQLIKVLTGKEVPSGGIPPDIGMVCFNVATAAAVYRAVVFQEPQISRIVTVTGRGVADPRNVEVLFGTPIDRVIEFCGGYTEQVDRLVMGGPMMGFTLLTDQVPVVKATNCILAMGRGEAAAELREMPCIRCGECARVCPAELLPQQLFWYARAKQFDRLREYHLFDCIECGCCAYVCPSHIPLVQCYRYAKDEMRAWQEGRQRAEEARARYENRLRRLEGEEAERAAVLQAKKAALRGGDPGVTDVSRKQAIQAAVQRARERSKRSGAEEGPGSERRH